MNRSGSVRFPVLRRFLGTDGQGEPARGSLVRLRRFHGFGNFFFRRFHGSTIRAGSKHVANGSGSGTVSGDLGPVRFQVTRSVAITIDRRSRYWSFFCIALGESDEGEA